MNSIKLKPVIVLGGGGHASVLVDILRSQKRDILAIVSLDDISSRLIFNNIDWLKSDDNVLQYSPDSIRLVNGIGMQPGSLLRRKVNEKFLAKGYEFESVISLNSHISPFAKLGNGVQVFSGAVIQAGAMIGNHTIINSGTTIEHDCNIGEYNHLAPRSTVCGQVITERDVYIGAGATVIQDIHIAHEAVVGAGAILTTNLSTGTVCYPCRSVIK